jgi:hypothetical protein
MQRASRRSLIGAAAAIVLAAAAVPAVLPAAATGSVDVDAGRLTLATGASDQVSLDGADLVGLGDLTQPLATAGTCDLSTDGSLLTFSGAVGAKTRTVGFRADSIGVIESSLTSLCNRVDVISFSSTETLTVGLGSALRSFDGTPLRATRASLDVEVRSWLGARARIEATARLGGTTVGTFELAQGSAACNVGDGGNCQWVIEAPGVQFDTLTLKALKGSFSLEGGADTQTPATSATTFDLVAKVDSTFECEDGASLTKGNATVTFVGTVDPEDCEGFGATLDADNESVRFLKPRDVDPTAQFVFGIGWVRAPGPDTTLNPTEVDWETPTPGIDASTLGWCPDPVYDGEVEVPLLEGGVEVARVTVPKLVGIADPLGQPDLDTGVGAADGTQFACVGSQYADVQQDGRVRIVEQIYVLGDIRLSKP